MNVGIVDYGAGNNSSVRNALLMAGASPHMARTPEDVLAADRLVLPGVGCARTALASLRARHLDQALNEYVHERARPLLGICLGLQMLAERCHEEGESQGLGWFAGDVVDLHQLVPKAARVPHMGWNQVTVEEKAEPFFQEVRGKREFYFCHTFALSTDDRDGVAATTDYFAPIVAAVLRGPVFATQFHPEKSQLNGQRLIEAFLKWTP
ncbi:MAG: imidazole glycerol phosphate synthase subunit HisH [Rhodospirillaceae bacterium]